MPMVDKNKLQSCRHSVMYFNGLKKKNILNYILIYIVINDQPYVSAEHGVELRFNTDVPLEWGDFFGYKIYHRVVNCPYE